MDCKSCRFSDLCRNLTKELGYDITCEEVEEIANEERSE